MRGKGPCQALRFYADGITPAYAGKRETPKGCVEHGGDHPRLCGEKVRPLRPAFHPEGSPPPMRGKG